MTIPTFLQSSHDPEKISLTIKGAVVFVPALVVFLGYFGIHVESQPLLDAVDKVAMGIAGLVTAYGLVRKAWAPSDGGK